MYWESILFIGVFLVISSCGLGAVMALDRRRREWQSRMSRAMENASPAPADRQKGQV